MTGRITEMRSRLLASAAVLVAGLAVASAQNGPGGAGQEHARSQHHRTTATAARKAEPLPRTRTTGSGLQDGLNASRSNQRSSERRPAIRGESLTSPRLRGARGDLRPPAKHNDASVQPPRGRGGRGDPSIRDRSLWDRSLWDRAMGQGSLRPEQDARLRRRQPALPLAKERGPQDLARNKAGGRDVRSRDQARGVAQHRGGAPDAGKEDQIRKVQTALNQQGFNVGNPDGRLGKRTKEALVAFQKQRGFRTTGKVDRTTLQALLAGEAASGGSQGSHEGSHQPHPTPAQAPVQAAPQGAVPSTTGQGGAAQEPLPLPAEGETPPAPPIPQMPDSGPSGRVPAGSPQEDYKEDDDQR
jgi:hypothetical protein